MVINFLELQNLFNNDEWDISYLTLQEMNEVLNHPIKIGQNYIEQIEYNPLSKKSYFLVVVLHTEDYDYSIVQKFQDKCFETFGLLNIKPFWCNYKYAAVLAGLGQYAKNSLLYHPRFAFDTHLAVFQVEEEIINLPQRKTINRQLLELCKGCTDCAKACPVGAIHNEENLIWIDMIQCDNFCFFGNDEKIPSIKWNNHLIKKDMTKEELKKITSYAEYNKIFPNANSFYASFVGKDGQVHWFQYPTCRECTSQKRCTKYNGHYPYDWNNVKIL